jgi:HEAT repeat protein
MKESRPEDIREPDAAAGQSPDRDLALQVFVRLNTARKIGEFSSSDHPLCLAAAELAAELAAGLNAEFGELKFTSAPGMISFGSTRFEPQEPYLDDFAAALRGASITVIRLGSGVSPDGLVRLARLLAASSDPEVGNGQIRQFLCGPVAVGIRVGMSPSTGVPGDTDHEQPGKRPARRNPAVEDAVWQDEVRRLLVGGSAKDAAGDKEIITALTDIDPHRMADLINGLDSIGSVDIISGSFLTRFLRHSATGRSGEDSEVPGGAVERYLELLRALSPGHQVKFITAALEMSYTFTGFAAAILEAVPIHLSAQAFAEIEKSRENTVHPLIADRFAALCRITGWSDTGEDDGPGEPPQEKMTGSGSGQGVMLNESPMVTEPEAKLPAPEPPPLDQITLSFPAAEFSLKGKRGALVRVTLDLLERSTSIDETRAYTGTLPALFTEALDERDWAGLNHDWAELTGLVQRGRESKPFLSQALHRIQNSFLTIQAMQRIVAAIENSTADTRTVLFEWLPRLGKTAGESLVLALVAASNRTQRRNLLTAIVAFGEEAIPLALKRITDHRWYVVRNMISIIREVGDKRAAEDLLALSDHLQFQVRRELVNTLLALEHSAGLELAEKGIQGSDLKMRSACIGLLGSHRVEGARNILLRILEDRFRGGVSFSQAQKISAVWALGQIGSSSVLPALHGLLRTKRLFKALGSHELKMAILRSLPDYPLEAVEPLARWGANHGDDEEAAICGRLLTGIRALPEDSGS